MTHDAPKNGYLKVSDFFRSSKATSIAEDVRRDMARERARTVLDLSELRRQEDWSLLAGQVVGAEDKE